MDLSKIKELKTRTGIGLADCKEALEASSGSVDEAIKWLQSRGSIKSADALQDSLAQGYIAAYQHHNGKVAVLLELRCETDFLARTEEFRKLANEIAMHVAAANPEFVSSSDISPAEEAAQKEIFEKQAKNLGRPEKIIPNIIAGKYNKWLQENLLTEQTLVTREDKTKVKDTINLLSQASGEAISIGKVARMEIGIE